jgi:ribonucleoside-diphosphate reductase alpha chain
MRNATCTSIAPAGTISLIAGTSASIEPLFALAYRRHALDGQTLTELNPIFVQVAQRDGFYSEELVRTLHRQGSLARVSEVPESSGSLFQTALDMAPEDHLRIQAAFQKHVDNAVSKTINLPRDVPADDIARIYRQAWEWGLKGIAVFRCGSKGQQVLALDEDATPAQHEHFAKCDPHACEL